MLRFSADQLQAMASFGAPRFDERMVVHASKFSPTLARVLGKDGMTEAVRVRLTVARSLGLTKRGPIRQVVELGLILGAGYVTDPQYPWARAAYDGVKPENEMARADFLHQDMRDYLEATAGPDNSFVWQALMRLAVWVREVEVPSEGDIANWMSAQIGELYPEKANYLGDEGVAAVVNRGIAVADHYNLAQPRPRALMASLILSFGHRCAEDPAYPWIGRTLTDPRIVNSEKRANRLERKALTWLDHVLQNAGVKR